MEFLYHGTAENLLFLGTDIRVRGTISCYRISAVGSRKYYLTEKPIKNRFWKSKKPQIKPFSSDPFIERFVEVDIMNIVLIFAVRIIARFLLFFSFLVPRVYCFFGTMREA